LVAAACHRGAEGPEIHKAIQQLHKTLLRCPELCREVEAIILTAKRSVSLDVVADEDEMVLLRDRWLRRINNGPVVDSQSVPEASDSISGFFLV
jgi:hypothetical protein